MSERSRKDELEAVHQTIRFFETLLRTLGDGIVITDATQNIVVVNEAFCALFGRRWRDVVETGMFVWLEQLDADAPRRWAELEKRVRLEGACPDVEFQMMTKDGVRHLSVNASLLERVADEEAGVIISLWRDVTERVQGEQALKKSLAQIEQAKQEWESTADALPQVVCLLDDQRRVLRANRTVERWGLAPVVDVRGRAVHALFHPGCADPACYLDTFWRYAWEELSRGQSAECEAEDKVLNRRLHIQVRPVTTQPSRLRGAATAFAAVVIHDITERKRAEEVLQQLTRGLGERVRELSCLYRISNLVETQDTSLEEILQGTVDLIPPAWRYPEVTCARIILEGQEFRTENFRETTWKQASDISVYGERIGAVEVCYLEERPESDEGPFQEEGRNLINAIAERLGRITERMRAEGALRQYADEQAALYTITSVGATSLDPDELLTTVLDVVLPLLDSDAGWVTLLGPTPDDPPRVVAWRGVPESFLAVEECCPVPNCPVCAPLVAGGGLQTEPTLIIECPRLPPEILADADLHSHIGIPLDAGDKVLGILNLAWRAPRLYSESANALLVRTGRQVGLALHNAQLYQAARQVDRLQALNAISAAAVSSLELDTVLRQVLKLTCQALDATEGSILLNDPDTQGLFFAATSADEGRAMDLRRRRLAPGQGIAGWTAQHGQSVRVNDVHQDPRWYGGIDAATGFETRSLLCAPLTYREEIIGVIEATNKRRGEFTEDDLSLLEAVSSIAAVALENARLYTTTRARADEMALLNEIGLALTSTLDYSTVVHAALSQLQRLFQADSVALLRADRQTGDLRFVRALVGRETIEIPVHLQPGEGIAGWALERRQPAVVADVQKDPRYSHRIDQYLGERTRALMAAPLLTPAHVIGVIEVTSGDPGVYTQDELHTLQTLASTLAVAVENASLYDELKVLLREREEAQAQLIHSEKMAALGRLVASIAHEINNPLQAVQGCLTLAEEELGEEQRLDTLQRYLDIAGTEIERVVAIVRRMRDFYRPAREGMQPTDLHAVLESVLALIHKQLQHSNVTVEREWVEQLPTVQANPDHLKQVFLNLMLNGIDAMPEGGILRVSTALDQMEGGDGQPPQRVARIEFSDTGEGMSLETQSRLFEPFFTTKEQGTGLGLSISYGIIQTHNGRIRVTSKEGVGTTFTVLLPVEQFET